MSLRSGALFVIALLLGLALVASALGWFGPAVVCGADGVPGCVVVPAAISTLVWLLFVCGVAGLTIWQVRERP